LNVVAFLIQLGDVPLVAPDALFREQDVGQHHFAELGFANEAAIAFRIGGRDIDMHIDIADGIAPCGVPLGLGIVVR
jgi:hypothetical protein